MDLDLALTGPDTNSTRVQRELSAQGRKGSKVKRSNELSGSLILNPVFQNLMIPSAVETIPSFSFS